MMVVGTYRDAEVEEGSTLAAGHARHEAHRHVRARHPRRARRQLDRGAVDGVGRPAHSRGVRACRARGDRRQSVLRRGSARAPRRPRFGTPCGRRLGGACRARRPRGSRWRARARTEAGNGAHRRRAATPRRCGAHWARVRPRHRRRRRRREGGRGPRRLRGSGLGRTRRGDTGRGRALPVRSRARSASRWRSRSARRAGRDFTCASARSSSIVSPTTSRRSRITSSRRRTRAWPRRSSTRWGRRVLLSPASPTRKRRAMPSKDCARSNWSTTPNRTHAWTSCCCSRRRAPTSRRSMPHTGPRSRPPTKPAASTTRLASSRGVSLRAVGRARRRHRAERAGRRSPRSPGRRRFERARDPHECTGRMVDDRQPDAE